jgi:hypothetical protein
MPIFEYQVYTPDGKPTGRTIEHLCSYSEKPKSLVSDDGHYALPTPSLPAKTPGAWHGNWSEGLSSNQYSAALGRKVANTYEEAKIMKAKGFIPESDLGHNWVANTQEKLNNHWKAQEDYSIKFKENMKTMSPEDAVAATWTAQECLDGTVDNIYKQPLTGEK